MRSKVAKMLIKLAKLGGAGHNARLLCIGGHHLGTEQAAIVQRQWQQNRGSIVLYL